MLIWTPDPKGYKSTSPQDLTNRLCQCLGPWFTDYPPSKRDLDTNWPDKSPNAIHPLYFGLFSEYVQAQYQHFKPGVNKLPSLLAELYGNMVDPVWQCLKIRAIQILSEPHDGVLKWPSALSPTQREMCQWDVPMSAAGKLWRETIQGANKAMSDTLFATLKNPYTELLKVLRVHDNNVNNLNDLNDHRLSNINPQLSKKELIEKLATVDRALAQYAESDAVFHDWLPALGDWLRDLVASSDNDTLSSPGSVEVSGNIQPQGQTASNSTNPGPAAEDGSDERIQIAPHSAIKPHTPRKPHGQVQLGGLTHTGMDMHDLIGYLNIGEFQDRARLRSSSRSELTSAQAHPHEDGVYSHPDLHIDREIINIPFLRPISTKHRSTGFERVQPRHHQVDTAALQLARGFSGDERLNRVDTFIFADEPGLGKTWTLFSYHAV